ncbi:MAG: sigma 54-interacting transcriptional regulator, partial [Myxococcota bacterium]
MASPSAPTQIVARPEGAVLVLEKSRLVVVRGPDKGRSLVVEKARVSVGSEDGCDLRLTDPSVSRRQFELRVEPEGFVLRDLGSTNGTTVDGMRVVEAYLRKSARIAAGGTEIKFAPLGESVELALSPRESFGAALGRSVAMRHVFAILERVATMDATVLIEGETGTGKELAAEGVHAASKRASGPFVVVDCGAIPENLVESELFGHEKGAFTGASEARAGAFEEADGGTLFLDEVGELPLELQPKLLRALESHEVRRVGSQKARALDLRIVAATNRDLATEVRAGKFREDLYYRLAVVRVVMPPLRERRDDVRLLARELARRARPQVDPASWLDEATLALLESHDWPGNVRELRNVVDRLAVFPGFGHAFAFDGKAPSAPG